MRRCLSLGASALALALMFFAGAPSIACAQTTGLGSPALDRFIEQQMDQMHTPGLAVAVVKHGRLIWSKGYGFADLENQVPATADTPFLLASISKTFTATAVMQLWEDGLFELDDDINGYLPFSVRNPKHPDVPITFRMLLEHDSSIHSRLLPVEFGADASQSLHDWLESYLVPGGSLYEPELNFLDAPPGTEFEYCNIGYGLLGYLVERISGQPFDEYCNAKLFAPLGMVNTSWRISDFPSFSIAPAVPYLYVGPEQWHYRLPSYGSPIYPMGQLNSSANELSKWLIAHMSSGGPILQPESAALMQTEYNQFASGGSFSNGYGLGFEITTREWPPTNPSVRIGHTGLFYGAAATMSYRPLKGVGVIVLANGDGGFWGPTSLWVPGWQLAVYSRIRERLFDEGIAAP